MGKHKNRNKGKKKGDSSTGVELTELKDNSNATEATANQERDSLHSHGTISEDSDRSRGPSAHAPASQAQSHPLGEEEEGGGSSGEDGNPGMNAEEARKAALAAKRQEVERQVKAAQEAQRLKEEEESMAIKRAEVEKKVREAQEAQKLKAEEEEALRVKRAEVERRVREAQEGQRLKEEESRLALEAARLEQEAQKQEEEERKRAEDEARKREEVKELRRMKEAQEAEKRAREEAEEAKRKQTEREVQEAQAKLQAAKEAEEAKRQELARKAKEAEESKRAEIERRTQQAEQNMRAREAEEAEARAREMEEQKKRQEMQEAQAQRESKAAVSADKAATDRARAKAMQDARRAKQARELKQQEEEQHQKQLGLQVDVREPRRSLEEVVSPGQPNKASNWAKQQLENRVKVQKEPLEVKKPGGESGRDRSVSAPPVKKEEVEKKKPSPTKTPATQPRKVNTEGLSFMERRRKQIEAAEAEAEKRKAEEQARSRQRAQQQAQESSAETERRAEEQRRAEEEARAAAHKQTQLKKQASLERRLEGEWREAVNHQKESIQEDEEVEDFGETHLDGVVKRESLLRPSAIHNRVGTTSSPPPHSSTSPASSQAGARAFGVGLRPTTPLGGPAAAPPSPNQGGIPAEDVTEAEKAAAAAARASAARAFNRMIKQEPGAGSGKEQESARVNVANPYYQGGTAVGNINSPSASISNSQTQPPQDQTGPETATAEVPQSVNGAAYPQNDSGPSVAGGVQTAPEEATEPTSGASVAEQQQEGGKEPEPAIVTPDVDQTMEHDPKQRPAEIASQSSKPAQARQVVTPPPTLPPPRTMPSFLSPPPVPPNTVSQSGLPPASASSGTPSNSLQATAMALDDMLAQLQNHQVPAARKASVEPKESNGEEVNGEEANGSQHTAASHKRRQVTSEITEVPDSQSATKTPPKSVQNYQTSNKEVPVGGPAGSPVGGPGGASNQKYARGTEENNETAPPQGPGHDTRISNGWQGKQGFLLKRGGSRVDSAGRRPTIFTRQNWKRRFFILDSDQQTLSYYKLPLAKDCLGTIALGQNCIVKHAVSHERKNVIAICCPGRDNFQMCTETKEELQDWLEALSQHTVGGY